MGKKLIIGGIVAAFFSFMMMVATVAVLMATAAAPFLAVAKAAGWFSGKLGGVASLIEDIVDFAIPGDDKTIKEVIAETLDCSTVSPDAREAGYCVEPQYAEEQSPIPPDKLWLVPVWQQAAKKYDIPWELVAAVNAARTDFGNRDCPEGKDYPGDGFFRIESKTWNKQGDAGKEVGHAALAGASADGPGCKSADEPTVMRRDGRTTAYDPVDAAFVYAKALKGAGARLTDWRDQSLDWEPAQDCRASSADGFIYRYDTAALGGDAGFNKNVIISASLRQLALKYTFATWGKPSFPASAGTIAGENDRRTIPRSVAEQLIVASGRGLGMNQQLINRVSPGLLNAIQGESGFRPAAYQGNIGDVNDAYSKKARGLFQLTPGTFWAGHVPGYNNIFNPLHNILAAMNIMRHATGGYYTAKPIGSNVRRSASGSSWTASSLPGGMGIWITGSGWSPQYHNPYSGQDPGQDASAAQGGKPAQIKLQNDPTSKALRSLGDDQDYSACYTAVVHDWYQAIVLNPPLAGGAAGRLGTAINIAKQELNKGVQEQPLGCNCGPEVNQYLLSVGIPISWPAPAKPWCASFVSWVYQKARIQPITLANMNGGRGSASVEGFAAFASYKHILRSPTFAASPGDLILFRDNAGHIGIVIGRTPTTITTIEGNSSDRVSKRTYNRSPGALAGSGVSGFVDFNALYGAASGGGSVGDNQGGTQGPGSQL